MKNLSDKIEALLGSHYIDRMEGLHSITASDNLFSSAMRIRDDLKEEGFEDNEIKLFLIKKIDDLF